MFGPFNSYNPYSQIPPSMPFMGQNSSNPVVQPPQSGPAFLTVQQIIDSIKTPRAKKEATE